jgi:hypothetical protein
VRWFSVSIIEEELFRNVEKPEEGKSDREKNWKARSEHHRDENNVQNHGILVVNREARTGIESQVPIKRLSPRSLPPTADALIHDSLALEEAKSEEFLDKR